MSDVNLNINIEDTELINEIKKGNRNAFNILVRKYQKKIYFLIRKMVLNHDDADDITQEVFIKLFQSINDFRGESKFFTYLYRMAVNFSLNHLLKNKKLFIKTEIIEDVNIPSKDMNADEMLDAKENSKLLEKAIETLPEQQRAVFNLRYYENLSYEEISKILEKSVGGMKANYFHAIKKIEKFLKCSKRFEYIESKNLS